MIKRIGMIEMIFFIQGLFKIHTPIFNCYRQQRLLFDREFMQIKRINTCNAEKI